jgi:hypothetical protein
MKPDRHSNLAADLILISLRTHFPDDWWLRAELIASHLEAAGHQWRVRGMIAGNQRIKERDAKRNEK